MSKKQTLGQFFTTNYKYILKDLSIPKSVKKIIEPFAGECDLLDFVKDKKIKVYKYDIDPKKEEIIKQDTLLQPPKYDNRFILTNPPYLARNKSKDKKVFDKYKQNDLYKCFIKSFIETNCIGGILIIPLNFWCSIRKNDIELRKEFLDKFYIIHINIFEEQVFDDTSYAVCSFQFERRIENKQYNNIKCMVYPSKKQIDLVMNEANNYTIGGEIYKLLQNKNIKVERATKKNKYNDGITNILVKCIDDSETNKISLSYVKKEERYIDETPKLSARSYATLVINPKLNTSKQKKLVENFNKYLEEQRTKYHSLFLTNYRESNIIARKRISFSLAFSIVNYLLNKKSE